MTVVTPSPELSRPADSSGADTSSAYDARKFAAMPDPFPLYRGGVLHQACIAYETWGELNQERDNAVLLFTGLSPPAHARSSEANPAPGWWEGIIGPHLAIDTSRLFVVCVNSLGSAFGSTSPLSVNPATGKPYRITFPDLSVEDIARGGHETLKSLGVERAHTVVGPSLGGMVVLAYAALFPGAARNLISISGTAAATPFAIALRSIQREAILRDPDFKAGQYTAEQPPETGMRIARKLGMMTYRSAAEWVERFGRTPAPPDMRDADAFGPEFAVQSYLELHARRFVRAFDPNCYLYLSRAMDRFDLGEHGESIPLLLKRSGVRRALIIGVESDMLFSIAEQGALADAFTAAGIDTHYAPLDCIEGHDSFLIDIKRFGREISGFLALDAPTRR
ncbi:MAG TPA: homoserine O-acetyltransferase [Steroidobacteraceae bacterium]|nr:homoserine O-acetyltransferase [Steroidobacteraceae bacterium]